MRLLLDTCTFIWLALDTPRIPPAASAAISDPGNEVFLSDVSVWEIVLKHSSGKLPLPNPPRLWLPRRKEFFQCEAVPITAESLYRSGELPGHPDPFDRLLIAQALENDFTVLTPDPPFRALGAKCVW